MPAQAKVLLTILSEALLEDTLIDEITALGAQGYTISEARGRGTHGVRTGKWTAGGNIRIEVIGDAALCARIVERLKSAYDKDYGLLMFTYPVDIQN
jgi:hypothetical protein